jgi:hypothetical protein
MTQTPSNPRATRLQRWWWLAGAAALTAAASGACYAWAARPLPAPEKHFVFNDDFEAAKNTADLLSNKIDGWDRMERDGAKGLNCNSVALTSERTHSGKQALKCVASPAEGKIISRADIECAGLQFKKGDHVWFSGWFWLPSDTDASQVFLWDLETSKLRNSPGRRLFLQDGESVASDLGKWWNAKAFRQPADAQVKFPKDRWVHVKIHLMLSEGPDGHMQVWQDGVRVLDAMGKTLPRASTVYDRMQVGVTANSRTNRTQTVYIDDVTLSNRPI